MKQAMVIIGTLLVFLCGPLSALANTLTVTPGPDGTVMMAADNGVEGASRIDLSFSFSSAFSEPRVIIQGGVFSEAQMERDSAPGFIKLVITRNGEEMLGAAFVLAVDFDVKPADQPCTVSYAYATYTYQNGKTASPAVTVLPPIVQKKDDPAADEAKAISDGQSKRKAASRSSAGRTTAPVSDGDAHPGDNKGGRSSGKEKSIDGDSHGAVEKSEVLEYRTCPDPLQRFREYRGDGKLAGLLRLFDFVNPCGCRQTPRVAVSDGVGKVAVTLEDDPASPNAPNFGISGARFVSVWRDSEHGWTIELLPNQGEHDVVLYAISGRVLKRIPLAVAAPLPLYLDQLAPGEALSPLLEYTIAVNFLAAHKETAANDRQ